MFLPLQLFAAFPSGDQFPCGMNKNNYIRQLIDKTSARIKYLYIIPPLSGSNEIALVWTSRYYSKNVNSVTETRLKILF